VTTVTSSEIPTEEKFQQKKTALDKKVIKRGTITKTEMKMVLKSKSEQDKF